MAAPCHLSADQFLCSICHDVFTEPVTLPCGHNFCKNCVDGHWPVDARCMCPQCKKLFFYRPELKTNIFIAKMAAQFVRSQYQATKSARPAAAKPAVVLCDVCTGPKLPARICCLLCLSSYCETHLKPHLDMCGLKKHQLMEPRRDTETKVGHELVPLREASKQQRLLLQKTEVDIEDQINRRMTKIDDLRGSVKVSDDTADRQISDGIKVFTALKESVERGLDLLISEITRKKTHVQQQAEGLIQELEQEISELEKRGANVKLLSQSDEPHHLLLNSPQLSSMPLTKDWADIDICPQTHEGTVVRALSVLQQDFIKKTSSLFEAEMKRVKTKEVDVTMETETVSSQLDHMDEQNHKIEILDSENQSKGLFLFAKQSFSESFYFETEVRGRPEWTLGVAKKPLKKNGPLTLTPQNGFWTIGLKNQSLYISDKPEKIVFRPERVGVFVDYKEGIVSFYDVDAAALIHSFTNATFDVRLSPICRATDK